MKSDAGRTVSVWMETAELALRPPLDADATADVCVVGAGIAGLTTAYLLAREGRKVVVVDDGPVAGGESSRTTAHLVNALDDRFYDLERLHGARGARLAAESHSAAVDAIERIVRELGIDCDFERLDGYLFAPPGTHESRLDEELAAARRAGLPVEKVDRAPIREYDTGPALRFPNQGQFHPTKYYAGLAHAIEAAGGRIHGGTHAEDFEGGEPARVRTAGGHTDHRPRAGHRHQLAGERPRGHPHQAGPLPHLRGRRAPVPAGAVTRALFWDTADPYHYVRLQRVDAVVGHADRRRRGPPHGPGGRRRRSVTPASRSGCASASPRRGRRDTAGRARCWSRRTASPSSAATPWTPATCSSPPATPATA